MNKTRLPSLFLENSKALFDRAGRTDEYAAFIASFDMEPIRGIRYNSLKVDSAARFEQILQDIVPGSMAISDLRSIPWSDDGYYLPEGVQPGRHPFYSAGLFYIQEPSAMLPAMLLAAKPGEAVLDICAAPGGKSVKIAADMRQTGILVSNDISSDRVKALVRNIELLGCSNSIVTNETPANLAGRFPQFFDKILIDAPCSGEGMFRRDENAARSWEKFGNDSCTAMQRDILGYVDAMLKPGGMMVYSTCTFSSCENEEMMAEFLAGHPDYTVQDLFEEGSLLDGIRGQNGPVRGISENPELRRTCRILPHISQGEGHYCAVLRKNKPEMAPAADLLPDGIGKSVGTSKDSGRRNKSGPGDAGTTDFSEEEFKDVFRIFAQITLSAACADRMDSYFGKHLKIYGGHVYTFNTPVVIPDGINVVKKGFYLGEMKKTRTSILYEPSHQLILSLKGEDLTSTVSFGLDHPFIEKYLKGETLFADPGISEGSAVSGRYVAVCVNGYPLGWAKAESGGMLKNLYPKGWRRQR